jgi:hypothetical protein
MYGHKVGQYVGWSKRDALEVTLLLDMFDKAIRAIRSGL